MGLLLLPSPASDGPIVIEANQREGEGCKDTETGLVVKGANHEARMNRRNSYSSSQIIITTTKQKLKEEEEPPIRTGQTRTTAKRRRFARNGIASSPELLFVFFSLALVAVLVVGGVEARPLAEDIGRKAYDSYRFEGEDSEICKAVMGIFDENFYPAVAVASFGKILEPSTQLNLPESQISLTVLPQHYQSLCAVDGHQHETEDETMHFPPGALAILVDMSGGDCDLLTKAYNAVQLQRDATKELKYVIFYKDLDPNLSLIPKLTLEISPPTLQPSRQPTRQPTSHPTSHPTHQPTNRQKWPTTNPTVSNKPTGSPTITSNPTMSAAPTTDPPTRNPSNNPTERPTASPTTTASPSVSAAPTTETPKPTRYTPTAHPTARPTAPFTPSPTTTASPSVSAAPTTETPKPTRYTPTANPTARPTRKDNIFEEPTLSTEPTLSSQSSSSTGPTESTSDPTTGGNLVVLGASYEFSERQIVLDLEQENDMEEQLRARQKRALENNDSMVFLSISVGDARAILHAMYERELRDMNPEFSMRGNQHWDMKIFFNQQHDAKISPACTRGKDPDLGYKPISIVPRPTYQPLPTPLPYAPTNGRQPTTVYTQNAPGSFAIFKFVLFGLLIASPFLRVIHQWWAGGGRIRFRRSDDGDDRVVGIQYIPPMDHWLGGGNDADEDGNRPIERLTLQQILSLPEIRYRKPIHFDEKQASNYSAKKTILEEEDEQENTKVDPPGKSSSVHRSEGNDAETEIENGDLTNALTETIRTVETKPSDDTASSTDPLVEGELRREDSFMSEASFENEPSVRLQLPTSPERVASTIGTVSQSSATNAGEPLSPRAIIVPTEEIPPDEETPEEQQEEEEEEEDSVVSEASFENEPSVRLQLPTSPERVASTIGTASQSSATNGGGPLSPRAIIVPTEEVPPDEETPEEQQQDEEQQDFPTTPLIATQQDHQQNQQQQELQQTPASPLPSPPLQEPSVVEVEEAAPMSFRTQRRLKSFTTTTCTTCSICIDEFVEGETIRLLPRCGHAFHTECIVPWLQDRQGCCPLCKMGVLDPGHADNSNNNNSSSNIVQG